MLLQIHENPDENFWVGMVKNGCDHFYHGTLKLIVSQEWIEGIFLDFLHAGWRWKRNFNISCVGMIKK